MARPTYALTIEELQDEKPVIEDNGPVITQEYEEHFQFITLPKVPTPTADFPTEYLCDQCPEKFDQAIMLERHKSTIHDKLLFKCLKCEGIFATKDFCLRLGSNFGKLEILNGGRDRFLRSLRSFFSVGLL